MLQKLSLSLDKLKNITHTHTRAFLQFIFSLFSKQNSISLSLLPEKNRAKEDLKRGASH